MVKKQSNACRGGTQLDGPSTLPTKLITGDAGAYGIKYLGGLNVGIRFRMEEDVKGFLDDKARWCEWIKWWEPGNKVKLSGERVAWVKIKGLPLELWDERNFSDIAKRFGRLIEPIEISMGSQNISEMKLSILTNETKKINENVLVSVGLNYMTYVGVFEVDDNWDPFKLDKVGDEVEASGSESDENKEESMVESSAREEYRNEEVEMEEGEIRYEDNIVTEYENGVKSTVNNNDVYSGEFHDTTDPVPEGISPAMEVPAVVRQEKVHVTVEVLQKIHNVNAPRDSFVFNAMITNGTSQTQGFGGGDIGPPNGLLRMGGCWPFALGPINDGRRRLPQYFTRPVNENIDEDKESERSYTELISLFQNSRLLG